MHIYLSNKEIFVCLLAVGYSDASFQQRNNVIRYFPPKSGIHPFAKVEVDAMFQRT